MHADLALMLLADARLPVAGHTQSGQLEAALASGLPPLAIPAYLVTRLETITAVEAGTTVVAAHRSRTSGSAAGLLEVERAWAARTPSPALREASRTQGRTLLRLAGRLWPTARGVLAAADLPGPGRAVVLGAVAAHLDLPPASLARLVGYDDVQTVCAAALKLTPLDPAEVTAWVRDALPAVDALAARVAPLTEPEEIPASGNPAIEAWAQAHAATSRRLFRA